MRKHRYTVSAVDAGLQLQTYLRKRQGYSKIDKNMTLEIVLPPSCIPIRAI